MMKRIVAAAVSAIFLAAVSAAPGAAQTPAPAAKPAEPAAKPKKRSLSAGMLAARERQKKCGAEWKEAKAAGKTKGMSWPKYWSACNKRLKAQGA